MRLLSQQGVSLVAVGASTTAVRQQNFIYTQWVMPPNRTAQYARVGDAALALVSESACPYARFLIQDLEDAIGSIDALSNWVFEFQLESKGQDGGQTIGPWVGCTSRVLTGGGRLVVELGTGALSRVGLRFTCGGLVGDAPRSLLIHPEVWG